MDKEDLKRIKKGGLDVSQVKWDATEHSES